MPDIIELTLPRESAGLLGANMETHFPMPTLRAGLDLYKANKVTHIWKDQFNIIHAIVGDRTSDNKLQIDLDFFMASECQCDAKRLCPHMAAVFFALYAKYEDPDRWLSDISAPLSAPRKHAAERQNTAASGIQGVNEPPSDRSDSAPERWKAQLAKELETLYRRHTDRFRIDIFYYTAFKKLNALAEDFPEERKTFFRLSCTICLMQHAEGHFARHAADYSESGYNRYAADLNDFFIERLRESVAAIDSSTAGREDRFKPFRETVRRLLSDSMPFSDSSAFQWTEAHRLLWGQLLNDEGWMEAEIVRLSEEEARFPDSPQATGKIAGMAAHLHWLLGRDAKAMAQLAIPHTNVTGLVVTYLETHFRTASWERLGLWLDFALPRLRRAPADSFNRTLSIWREYAKRTGNDSTYQHALSSLLPRSYPQYSDYLIKMERDHEWIHFHLLNGISPAKIDRTQLSQLERRSAALVLPLYHHAVERQLASRNRNAYRETVKLIKKLKALYETVEPDGKRFSSFMAELTARNQRLHAFMDELAKGKLLG